MKRLGKIVKQAQGPRSRFVRVKCSDCESEQVTFNKASVRVNCQVCGASLVEPRGGVASFKGPVVDVLE